MTQGNNEGDPEKKSTSPRNDWFWPTSLTKGSACTPTIHVQEVHGGITHLTIGIGKAPDATEPPGREEDDRDNRSPG